MTRTRIYFQAFDRQADADSALDWARDFGRSLVVHAGYIYGVDRCTIRMPAIPLDWMDSAAKQLDGLMVDPWTWAAHAHHLVAPRVHVNGYMALIVLAVVLSAFSWYVAFD